MSNDEGHQRHRKDLHYYLIKGENKLTQSKLFPCYFIPLRDFLSKNGVKYELVGLHPKTHKMFWVYIKDEKLNKLTLEWSKK